MQGQGFEGLGFRTTALASFTFTARNRVLCLCVPCLAHMKSKRLHGSDLNATSALETVVRWEVFSECFAACFPPKALPPAMRRRLATAAIVSRGRDAAASNGVEPQPQ